MDGPAEQLDLDIVVPVYNEERTLERSVRSLHRYLSDELPESWRITIADNASTDGTAAIADALAAEFENVCAEHLAAKGRGRALKTTWLASPARVVAYLDEDLSTDLAAIRPLVAPLLSGHSDLAIGTRLARSSRVTRADKREFISRSYNLLLRRIAGAHFSDAQCGFKAIRSDVARRILPLVEDTGWFFDTELLILAERAGLRIHEVPVDWIDDPDSSVNIAATAIADLNGLARVMGNLARGRVPLAAVYAELGRHPFQPPTPPTFFRQVVRFAAVGVASTVAYALLYVALQGAMGSQVANFVALLLTAIANTWANRRFTFGVRGPDHAVRQQLQGLIVFGFSWAFTAGSLATLHAVDPKAGQHLELAVLMAANVLATVIRFVLLRVWVFRLQRRSAGRDGPVGGPEADEIPDILDTPYPGHYRAQEANRS